MSNQEEKLSMWWHTQHSRLPDIPHVGTHPCQESCFFKYSYSCLPHATGFCLPYNSILPYHLQVQAQPMLNFINILATPSLPEAFWFSKVWLKMQLILEGEEIAHLPKAVLMLCGKCLSRLHWEWIMCILLMQLGVCKSTLRFATRGTQFQAQLSWPSFFGLHTHGHDRTAFGWSYNCCVAGESCSPLHLLFKLHSICTAWLTVFAQTRTLH